MDEKKIPFETIRNILDERIAEVDSFDFYGTEITVKRMIPFDAYCTAIDRIIDSCYDSESGEYLPELRELSTRMVIMAYYTNLELPEDMNELERMMFCGELMAHIYDLINPVQLRELHQALSKRCEIRNEANRRYFDSELYKVIDGVNAMSSEIRSFFGGISDKEMKRLAKALTSGKINEEKLVDAVIKAQNTKREDEEKVIPFPAEEKKDGE